MGQINTNNYPTVNSLLDADLLIVENATNGTGTTTPKQLRENAIGTDTLQTSAQSVTGAINELKTAIDAGAGVVCYDVNTITSGYLGGQFSGAANLLLLHLTTDGTADATNGYMMMLSYTRPVARFAYGRLVDADGVAYKQDVYADNTIICKISNSGEGTESDPEQVVILGIINAGFMLTPTAVVSDRDIIDGQGNTLSVLAEALTKTASGNPVVISDCAGGKARSLITEINAIQDLHGYDHPWAGGSGKNKLSQTVASIKAANTDGTWTGNVYAINNGTVEILTDNDSNIIGYKVNGTFNAIIIFKVGVPTGGDILNGCPSGGSWESYLMYQNNGAVDSGSGGSGVITTANVVISVASGYNASNLIFRPMTRANDASADFAPWENKCPISGRTAVAVDDTGANLIDETALIAAVLDPSTGQPTPASDIKITPFIKVSPSSVYSLSNLGGGSFRIFSYAADKGFIERSVSYNTDSVITTGATWGYIRIQGANTSWTNTDLNFSQRITATIQLGQTVYGADINWDTGVMTVTDAIVDIGTLDFTPSSPENHIFRTDSLQGLILPPPDGNTPSNAISSAYKAMGYVPLSAADDGRFAVAQYGATVYARTVFIDHRSSTVAEFIANNSGQTLCYELEHPTTLQLTPTQLQMLKGYNRVTIESGSIELGYIAKLT